MGLRTWLGLKKPQPAAYWRDREDAIYLQYVFFLARTVGRKANSIVDVGSNECPYLEWFHWIPRKVSIDMRAPYSSPNVRGIQSNFLTMQFKEPFDLCLCLQVIEHVPDAESFAKRLLSVAPHLIISVPYRWPAGVETDHVQDPVDEEKIARWFGRRPNYQIIATEPFWNLQRLICYFDRERPSRQITGDEIRKRRRLQR